jgi:hypothetical protein
MILELKNAFKHVPDLGVDATGSALAWGGSSARPRTASSGLPGPFSASAAAASHNYKQKIWDFERF